MSPSTVSASAPPTPTPAAAPVVAPPAVQPAAADVAALNARLSELEGQVGEHKRTAQFWYEKATKGAKAAEPAAPAEPEVDVLDVLTTKGAKGLDELLAKRGYVRSDEVDTRVNAKATQIVREQQLLKDYPDLGKKDSDFFKAAALHYGELKKRGLSEVDAMELGAERAELELIRAGKRKTPTQQAEDDKATLAAERRARALAGAGDSGNRTAQGADDDDELTPEQRRTAIAMLSGDGVTEEQAVEKYKARAKKGVTVSRR